MVFEDHEELERLIGDAEQNYLTSGDRRLWSRAEVPEDRLKKIENDLMQEDSAISKDALSEVIFEIEGQISLGKKLEESKTLNWFDNDPDISDPRPKIVEAFYHEQVAQKALETARDIFGVINAIDRLSHAMRSYRDLLAYDEECVNKESVKSRLEGVMNALDRIDSDTEAPIDSPKRLVAEVIQHKMNGDNNTPLKIRFSFGKINPEDSEALYQSKDYVTIIDGLTNEVPNINVFDGERLIYSGQFLIEQNALYPEMIRTGIERLGAKVELSYIDGVPGLNGKLRIDWRRDFEKPCIETAFDYLRINSRIYGKSGEVQNATAGALVDALEFCRKEIIGMKAQIEDESNPRRINELNRQYRDQLREIMQNVAGFFKRAYDSE